jgi:hypothetical protein
MAEIVTIAGSAHRRRRLLRTVGPSRTIARIRLAIAGAAFISFTWAAAPGAHACCARSDGATTPASAARAPVAAAAPADELGEKRAAGKGLLIKGLLELATWSGENELYLERDNFYHQVIELDADNLEARKGLRFARNPDGSWKEPAPREAKNHNEAALAKLPRKRAELLAPYCDVLLDFVEQSHPDAATTKLVMDEINRIDPENVRLHRKRGDAEVAGKWTTPETLVGKQRRADIKASLKRGQDAAAKVTAEAEASSPGVARKWRAALLTPNVHVIGDITEPECQKIARQCEVAVALMRELLGWTATTPRRFTIYVFASEEDKNAYVSKLADVSVEDHALLLSKANVGLPDGDRAYLSDGDPAKRLDAAVRYMFAFLLSQAYGLNDKQAWLSEGLGLYLTHEVCGTHFTWLVLGTMGKDQAALRAKLLAPGANWMDEAAKVLEADKAPRLDAIVALNVRSMRMEEMLCAYALTGLLIEGHPAELPEIMKRVGKGDATALVLKTTIGISMDDLQVRLTHWLKERR